MIYVHVPFCASFCTYCGFYSEIPGPRCGTGAYIDALLGEIAARRSTIPRAPRTLYIGGGTPSLLPIEALRRIVTALDGGPYDEFTLEANPEDIVAKGPAYATGLRDLGVNRISLGVQSFDDGILRWMHRRHDAARAREAVRILRAAGLDNISLDLIFGLSQLTAAGWDDTISAALECRPRHISAYQLSVEPGSALETLVGTGRYTEAAEETCRDQYARLCARLAAAGFRHYEISNFALPGAEALHNSAYWRRVPYIGFGPAAHSFDGRRRSWNAAALPDYLSGREEEVLTAEDVRVETLMLGLRTDAGVDAAYLHGNCSPSVVDRLLEAGALVRIGSRIRIPEDRWIVSDAILRDLI